MSRSFSRDAPLIDAESRALLRTIAQAADTVGGNGGGGRRWVAQPSLNPEHPGYPQSIVRMGDVVLIATTYDEPTGPLTLAQYIAAVSPPVVLALLDELDRQEAPA